MAMKKKRQKRGPKPNHLQLDNENWEDAVKKAVLKKKPKDGWPKEKEKSQ